MNLIDLMNSMPCLKNEKLAYEYFESMGVNKLLQDEIIRCYNFEQSAYVSVCSFHDEQTEQNPVMYSIQVKR